MKKKPIICAHRGFGAALPENTIPAFAAAEILGADEIELDLWPSADGEIYICHDPELDRTCSSSGLISKKSSMELEAVEAGSWFSPVFAGTPLPKFDEMLKRFGGKIMLNLHIKSPPAPNLSPGICKRDAYWAKTYNEGRREAFIPPLKESGNCFKDFEERETKPYDEDIFKRILTIIDRYSCRNMVYISGERDVLETARRLAPDIERCCLEGDENFSIVENALIYGCRRLQFNKLFLTEEMIKRAKAQGLICNLFWSDCPEEAEYYSRLGIDVILTNDCLRLIDHFKKKP